MAHALCYIPLLELINSAQDSGHSPAQLIFLLLIASENKIRAN
jgi:hypothetical protein